MASFNYTGRNASGSQVKDSIEAANSAIAAEKIFKKGKRIFLMSPLHHHFELKGIKEEKIVENFWKVNTILVILGIVLKIYL